MLRRLGRIFFFFPAVRSSSGPCTFAKSLCAYGDSSSRFKDAAYAFTVRMCSRTEFCLGDSKPAKSDRDSSQSLTLLHHYDNRRERTMSQGQIHPIISKAYAAIFIPEIERRRLQESYREIHHWSVISAGSTWDEALRLHRLSTF